MKKMYFAVAAATFIAPLMPLFVTLAHAATSGNNVVIGNFSVTYPDGWSTLQNGQSTIILGVPVDRQASLGDQFVFTPQINVSTEQRSDAADALKQLDEIAAGAGVSVNKITVDGSPAIQWRSTAPWPQAGGQAPSTASSALIVNTVVANGSHLIRLYGSLPSDAPSSIVDAMVGIENSVRFTTRSGC